MSKEFIVGNGVRLTESEDMGIFMQFESISGKKSGWCLEEGKPGHEWAKEILKDVDDKGGR